LRSISDGCQVADLKIACGGVLIPTALRRRLSQAPQVETHILPSALTPCGAGQMGIPSAAQALANALYAATGQRTRRLPMRKS
jgi:hypothetical protein